VQISSRFWSTRKSKRWYLLVNTKKEEEEIFQKIHPKSSSSLSRVLSDRRGVFDETGMSGSVHVFGQRGKVKCCTY